MATEPLYSEIFLNLFVGPVGIVIVGVVIVGTVILGTVIIGTVIVAVVLITGQGGGVGGVAGCF